MMPICFLPKYFQIEPTHFANIRSPAGWVTQARTHPRLTWAEQGERNLVSSAGRKASLSVNCPLTAAAVGVPKQSTAAQEIMTARQREKSLCEGGKKLHECARVSLWVFQCTWAKHCRLARTYFTHTHSPNPICRLHLPRCFLELPAACLRQMCSPPCAARCFACRGCFLGWSWIFLIISLLCVLAFQKSFIPASC